MTKMKMNMSKNKWIDAERELPGSDRECIVYIPEKQDIELGFIWNGQWITPYRYVTRAIPKVAYWMDLPEEKEWKSIEKDGLPKEIGWYFCIANVTDPFGEHVIWKTLFAPPDFISWDNTIAWTINDRITHWIPLPEEPIADAEMEDGE